MLSLVDRKLQPLKFTVDLNFFLCPPRILLSNPRGGSVGTRCSLCHFSVSLPELFPSQRRSFSLSHAHFAFLFHQSTPKFKQNIILGKYSSPLTPCTEAPGFSALFLLVMTRSWCRASVLRGKTGKSFMENCSFIHFYPFWGHFGGNPSCLCGQSPADHSEVVPLH